MKIYFIPPTNLEEVLQYGHMNYCLMVGLIAYWPVLLTTDLSLWPVLLTTGISYWELAPHNGYLSVLLATLMSHKPALLVTGLSH